MFFRRGRPPLLDEASDVGHGIESIFMDDRKEPRAVAGRAGEA
jgi:hypothetical protein